MFVLQPELWKFDVLKWCQHNKLTLFGWDELKICVSIGRATCWKILKPHHVWNCPPWSTTHYKVELCLQAVFSLPRRVSFAHFVSPSRNAYSKARLDNEQGKKAAQWFKTKRGISSLQSYQQLADFETHSATFQCGIIYWVTQVR